MPNRRDFLKGLFTILPAAVSYKRIWKALENSPILQPEYIPDFLNSEYKPNPDWLNAPFEIAIFTHELTMDGNVKLKNVETMIFKRGLEVEKEKEKLNVNYVKFNFPLRFGKDGNIIQPFKV